MADPQISIATDGPHLVSGAVPLRRRAPIVSERGEPLTWPTGAEIEANDRYALGDGSHAEVGFQG